MSTPYYVHKQRVLGMSKRLKMEKLAMLSLLHGIRAANFSPTVWLLFGGNKLTYDVFTYMEVEDLAHELAHWVELGQPLKNYFSITETVTLELVRVRPWVADRHEARTVAIEELALRGLGIVKPRDTIENAEPTVMPWKYFVAAYDRHIKTDLARRQARKVREFLLSARLRDKRGRWIQGSKKRLQDVEDRREQMRSLKK